MLQGGEEQSLAPDQGLCHHDSTVAAMGKCSASGNAHEQVCSFTRSPPQGAYQVCLCMAEGPKCQGFLPLLGTLQIMGVENSEDASGVFAPLLISFSLVLFLCAVPLLLFPRLRKKLWRRISRKLGRRSSVMAVPTKDSAPEEEQHVKEEMDEKDIEDKSSLQPEEEPEEQAFCNSQLTKLPLCPEQPPALPDDVPSTFPDVPGQPSGCQTPEEVEEEPVPETKPIPNIPEVEPVEKPMRQSKKDLMFFRVKEV